MQNVNDYREEVRHWNCENLAGDEQSSLVNSGPKIIKYTHIYKLKPNCIVGNETDHIHPNANKRDQKDDLKSSSRTSKY